MEAETKRAYKRRSDKEKAQIVYYAKKHGMKKAVEIFECAESQIYEWRKKFEGESEDDVKLREVPVGGKDPLDSDEELEDEAEVSEEQEAGDPRDAEIESLKQQVFQLQWLLGRKTAELELLKEQTELEE